MKYRRHPSSTVIQDAFKESSISFSTVGKFDVIRENQKPQQKETVSILPVLSKIFEKLMSEQLYTFFENILPKFQCGFRKGYSTQHCLLLMLEKWKLPVGNKEAFGALLTDISKAFDCLNHDLTIAKLHSNGLSLTSLRLLSDYL